MFRRILIGSLLLLRAVADPAVAPGPAVTRQEVSVASGGRSLRLTLLIFSGRDCRIRVIDNAAGNDQARFPTLADAMQFAGCVAGCNGGFFDRKPFSPAGLMVSDGRRTGRFDPDSWMKGLIVVRGNTATLESTENFQDSPDVTELIQSGPWLVREGRSEPDSSRPQVARRTFVGHDSRGTWVIGASERCTLAELAAALRSREVAVIIDLQSALNLDGGPSTGLWLRDSPVPFYLPERWPVRNYLGLTPHPVP